MFSGRVHGARGPDLTVADTEKETPVREPAHSISYDCSSEYYRDSFQAGVVRFLSRNALAVVPTIFLNWLLK